MRAHETLPMSGAAPPVRTPLCRQVLPACRGLPGLLFRVAFISACMAFAFMDAADRWAPSPNQTRREMVLERIHEVPVPSLCESRHGVWQRCYWDHTKVGP